MLHQHAKLFTDPLIQYPIDNFNLPFANYIEKNKKIIANTREDISQYKADIIEANAPFELRPVEKPTAGVLLIHGLLDSPFIMQDIGRTLVQHGCLVRSVLLPGHGTVPGALLNTNYAEWIQTVRYGIATLKSEVEKIFLIGHSTGALLSLYHAAEDSSINGVAAIAPAIKINSAFDFVANWHHILSWAWERAKWFYIAEESDYTKYISIPYNAIYQVYHLAKIIKKIPEEKFANCPIFMVSTYEDRIVCSKASMAYFKKNKNPANHLLLYAGKKLREKDPRITVRSSFYPELGIKNFSHVSLPIAPTNPHYGEQGDYALASHINKNKFIYGAQNKIETWIYDFLYHSKLIKFQHHRLTFNPDFNHLMDEIETFRNLCNDRQRNKSKPTATYL